MTDAPAVAAPGGERRFERRLAPFRQRDFRLLFTAFLVDSIGSWASTVVVALWIYEQTGSLTLLAVQTAARWIPALFLAPIAGVLADRFDRRRIMLVCATLSGLVATCSAITIGVNGPYAIILVLTVLSAVVASPYRPAAGALTPEVVDEPTLPAANSTFAALEQLVVVIGPAIGGLLVLTGEPWIGVAINAASFFAAAIIASRLRVRSRGEAAPGESVARQFRAGIAALAAAPTAGVLLAFAALDSLIANLYSVLFIPISAHVGLGAGGYGFLLAGAAFGGVLGAGLADRLSAARRLAPVIIGGLMVQALPYALTAFTDVAGVAIVLQALSGAGMIVVDVLALTAIQREVRSGALSRVLSLLDMGVLAAGVVGGFAVAGLLAALPLMPVLLIVGLGATVLALALAPLLVRADRKAAAVAAGLTSLVGLLDQVDLFQGLARPALERLAAAAVERKLAAGEVLLQEGDAADAVWVLASGSLDVESRASTAAGVALPVVVAPDAVGEIGVLRGLPRTASVVARSEAVVLRISAQDYLDAVTSDRVPMLFSGRPAARLARTHPQLVDAPAAG